ncbi:MAG: Ig-like domain-containing protein, partial [Mycolicibacterium sp.]|uniref:Ig-like domain-containing protein n=1 Tax=Mycolicibacterium sp. TaxID=2320850 RepID=UPI003D14DCB4
MPAQKKRNAQPLVQHRHAGTGLDYEAYARWLRVSTVVFGLGAAIATGSGVAAATPDDAGLASDASVSQSAGDNSDDNNASSATTNQDPQSLGRDSGSDGNSSAASVENTAVADEVIIGEADEVIIGEADDAEQPPGADGSTIGGPYDEYADLADGGKAPDNDAPEELPAVELPPVRAERVQRSVSDADTGDPGDPEVDALVGSPASDETTHNNTTTGKAASSSVPVTPDRPGSAEVERALTPTVAGISSASPAAGGIANARQQESVTVNSIVTDLLHWVGLGSRAADLPFPSTPVPLLVQSLWLFVREVQYTWNNQRPTVGPTISGPGPDGVITGSINAVDYDDASLTYVVAAQPGHGTVTVDANGHFTYTPNAGTEAITDTFTVTVDDTVGNPRHLHSLLGMLRTLRPRQAVVTVSLDGSELPTVGRQSAAINLKSIVTDVLHWVGLGRLANRLSIPETTVSTGVQSWWQLVREVQYTWNNQRPTVGPTISGPGPDGVITGSINAVDYDDASLTYVVAAQPGHGTVTVDANGHFTYTPNAGTEAITDTFTVTVDDTVGNPRHLHSLLGMLRTLRPRQAVVTVSLDGSELPTVGRQSAAINLKSIVTDVLHWVGLGRLANRLSIPETTVSTGVQSWWQLVREIQYRRDNQSASASPTITGQAVDGTITGNLNAVDYDDTTLSYTVTGAPRNGTVAIDVNGQFTYTPNEMMAAAGGADSFIVAINDTIGTPTHYRGLLGPIEILGPGRVRVTVRVEPIGPQPIGDGYTSGDSDPATGTVAGTVVLANAGTEPLTYLTDPLSRKGGTVLVDVNGRYTYTPTHEARHIAAAEDATAEERTDTFTVTATDGFGGTTTVSVTVDVEPANADPTGVADPESPNPSTGSVTGTVVGADTDGDTLTYRVTGAPIRGGAVALNSATGAFTYTPTDEARHAAAAQSASTFTPIDGVRHAAAAQGATQLTDTFEVTITDGHGGATTVSVTVDIEPANTAPTAEAATTGPGGDGVTTGTLTVVDPDGDTPAFSVAAAPTRGAVTINPTTGAFTYTPTDAARHAAAADGATAADLADIFTITVDDGHGGTADVPVTVTIGGANTAPTAEAATTGPDGDGVTTGTLTVVDPDGDTPAFSVAAAPTRGAVTIDPTTGAFTYTPTDAARHAAAADGAGPSLTTDTFTITLTDGHGGTADVPVTVTIGAANTAPTAEAATTGPDGDGVTTGTLTVVDPDGGPPTFSVAAAPT